VAAAGCLTIREPVPWIPVCLPSLIETNPLVWMAQVNGLVVDLRDMPREVQEIAFEKGTIPYILVEQRGDEARN
jgi:hypothetical protein